MYQWWPFGREVDRNEPLKGVNALARTGLIADAGSGSPLRLSDGAQGSAASPRPRLTIPYAR